MYDAKNSPDIENFVRFFVAIFLQTVVSGPLSCYVGSIIIMLLAKW